MSSSGDEHREKWHPPEWHADTVLPKKSPAFAGLFSLTPYLLRPEPGPVGVNVDPLGEGLAPTVLPDGFLEL